MFRPRAISVGFFIHLFVLSALSNPVEIPVPTEQAVAYQNVSNIAWGINQILTVLLPVVFLILALKTRISNEFLRHRKYPAFVVIATLFFILNWLIQLPLERMRTSSRNELENNPISPASQWILNNFVESLPLIIFSILATLAVYWLTNKSPQKWWLWSTCVFSLLFLVLLMMEPIAISYKPLGQTPTEVKISELAQLIGIPIDSIVLENCEPFDKCEIAHVSGLGPTRLILLNKGLFDNYPESWAIQTFAHESKHFVNDDNLLGWLVLTLLSLFGFWSLNQICRTIIQRFFSQPGFSLIGPAVVLPLMVLVLNIMYLIALPPINMFRQHVEFEADRYGLELTHENKALAEMVSSWTKSSRLRVPNPSRFFMLFRSSHPSDAARISFANEFQLKGKRN